MTASGIILVQRPPRTCLLCPSQSIAGRRGSTTAREESDWAQSRRGWHGVFVAVRYAFRNMNSQYEFPIRIPNTNECLIALRLIIL